MKNGIVVNKSYEMGTLHGPVTYSYPHSQAVQKVEYYNQGNIEKETSHYFSGAPFQEVQYTENGKILSKWYETGSPLSREEYQGDYLMRGEYYNPEHQLESSVENGSGTRTRRDSYGLILSYDTIVNGQFTYRTTYHPNGNPKDIMPYVNNMPEGERRTFLPAGEPYTIETWNGGKQHGVTVVFLNGEKVSEVPYNNGVRHGEEKRFRDGETLVEEVNWENGQRHGPSKAYIGNTATTDWYYQNQRVSKSNFDQMSTTAR
jgi:antitoxin component YwqK of YwqJK toxin-antitoxin module